MTRGNCYRVDSQRGLHGDIFVVLTPSGRICAQFDGPHARHDARARASDLNSRAQYFARISSRRTACR